MSRLDPRLLLQGYAAGIFPMADSREASELFWVEPRSRAVIPLDKFHVSLARGAAAAPLPLRRLYLMVDGAQVGISPRTGFAAIEAVRQSVYRRHFLQPLGCEQSSFRLCAALASSARIAVLTRPRGFDFLGQVLQELAAEWSLASA